MYELVKARAVVRKGGTDYPVESLEFRQRVGMLDNEVVVTSYVPLPLNLNDIVSVRIIRGNTDVEELIVNGYVNKYEVRRRGQLTEHIYTIWGRENIAKYRWVQVSSTVGLATVILNSIVTSAGLSAVFYNMANVTISVRGLGLVYANEAIDHVVRDTSINYYANPYGELVFFIGTIGVSSNILVNPVTREEEQDLSNVYNRVLAYSFYRIREDQIDSDWTESTIGWRAKQNNPFNIWGEWSVGYLPFNTVTWRKSPRGRNYALYAYGETPWKFVSRRRVSANENELVFESKMFWWKWGFGKIPFSSISGLSFEHDVRADVSIETSQYIGGGQYLKSPVSWNSINTEVLVNVWLKDSYEEIPTDDVKSVKMSNSYNKIGRDWSWSTLGFNCDMAQYLKMNESEVRKFEFSNVGIESIVRLKVYTSSPLFEYFSCTGTLHMLLDCLHFTEPYAVVFEDTTSSGLYGVRHLKPVEYGIEPSESKTSSQLIEYAKSKLTGKTIPTHVIKRVEYHGTVPLWLGYAYTLRTGDVNEVWLLTEREARVEDDYYQILTFTKSPGATARRKLYSKLEDLDFSSRLMLDRTSYPSVKLMPIVLPKDIAVERVSAEQITYNFGNVNHIIANNLMANTISQVIQMNVDNASINVIGYVATLTASTANINHIQNVNNLSATLANISTIQNVIRFTAQTASISVINRIDNLTVTNATISNIYNVTQLNAITANISTIQQVSWLYATNASINLIRDVSFLTATNASIAQISTVQFLNVIGSATIGTINKVDRITALGVYITFPDAINVTALQPSTILNLHGSTVKYSFCTVDTILIGTIANSTITFVNSTINQLIVGNIIGSTLNVDRSTINTLSIVGFASLNQALISGGTINSVFMNAITMATVNISASTIGTLTITTPLIGTGVIRAENLTIIGENLVPDGGFESGDIREWTGGAVVSTSPFKGNYCLRLSQTFSETRSFIPIKPGEKIRARGFARVEGDAVAFIYIDCYNDVKSYVTTLAVGYTSSTSWTEIVSNEITIPSNVYFIKVTLLAMFGTAYFDELEMYRISRTVDISDGAVTASKIATEAVETRHIKFTSYPSISQIPLREGLLAWIKTPTGDVDYLVFSGSTSLDRVAIIPKYPLHTMQVPHENFVINGDFEIDRDSDGKPDFWSTHTVSGSPTFGISTATSSKGARSVFISLSGAGDARWVSDLIPVPSGSKLTLQLSYRGDIGRTHEQPVAYIIWYNRSGEWVGESHTPWTVTTTSWTRRSFEVVVPSDACWARVVLRNYSSSTTYETIFWDDVMLSEIRSTPKTGTDYTMSSQSQNVSVPANSSANYYIELVVTEESFYNCILAIVPSSSHSFTGVCSCFNVTDNAWLSVFEDTDTTYFRRTVSVYVPRNKTIRFLISITNRSASSQSYTLYWTISSVKIEHVHRWS